MCLTALQSPAAIRQETAAGFAAMERELLLPTVLSLTIMLMVMAAD